MSPSATRALLHAMQAFSQLNYRPEAGSNSTKAILPSGHSSPHAGAPSPAGLNALLLTIAGTLLSRFYRMRAFLRPATPALRGESKGRSPS